jgi:deazaflavin-dependent oxidoreductase (nitroreductase family)
MDLSRIEQIPAVKAIGAQALRAHHFLYERSGGRIGHQLLGVPCLLLRTVGAKSGQPRTSSLTYARDAQDYLVVASYGGAPRAPGWYHNLVANPAAEIQVGVHRYPVIARAVHPGDADYERMWDAVNANNHDRYRGYQKATSRPIPVVTLSPQPR